MVEQSEVESLAAFAVRAGYKLKYVRLLRDQGRLVMADDGKSVLVAESLARIAETRDPSNRPKPDETTEETFAAFAARLNYKPPYIYQLRDQGRLVMSDDGKRVRVLASMERIRATESMTHQGVADRHAATRQPADGDDEEEAAPSAPSPEQRKYQTSRAEREHWAAQAARRDYELSMRQLLPAADVESAIADGVTQIRARLEALPDILAPQLAAEPDEAKCRALLADEIEHALTELARAFGNVARTELN